MDLLIKFLVQSIPFILVWSLHKEWMLPALKLAKYFIWAPKIFWALKDLQDLSQPNQKHHVQHQDSQDHKEGEEEPFKVEEDLGNPTAEVLGKGTEAVLEEEEVVISEEDD